MNYVPALLGRALAKRCLKDYSNGFSTLLSLGIETNRGLMQIFLPRGTKVPCSRTEMFLASAQGQEGAAVKVEFLQVFFVGLVRFPHTCCR